MSTTLIVVDVQNDFCEGGSLAVTGGNHVAEMLARLLDDARGGYQYVIATRDHHIDPGAHFSETPDFVDSWPSHCVVGTPGQELHPGRQALEHVLRQPRAKQDFAHPDKQRQGGERPA